MSWQFVQEIEEHADYIGGTEKLVLVYVAMRCFEPDGTGAPRTSGGKAYGPREVFFMREQLERFAGVSGDAVRKACARLEDRGLMVRKRHMSASGREYTARPGESVVYVLPTVAQLEAARPAARVPEPSPEWADDGPAILAEPFTAEEDPHHIDDGPDTLDANEWQDDGPGSGRTTVRAMAGPSSGQ